jgi:hypothetical protein
MMAHLFEHKVVLALKYLIDQVEEDCPMEYRTKHLIEAIEDAKELIKENEDV